MPAVTPEVPLRGTWVTANGGNIYYRPRTKKKTTTPQPHFPRPLIEPRRTRPQAIHIVSYPSGYIPHELRPTPESIRARKKKVRAARERQRRSEVKKKAKPQSQAEGVSNNNNTNNLQGNTQGSGSGGNVPRNSISVGDQQRADQQPQQHQRRSSIHKFLGSLSNSHSGGRRLSIFSTATAIEEATADRPASNSSNSSNSSSATPPRDESSQSTGVLPTILPTNYFNLIGPGDQSDVIRPAADSIIGLYPPLSVPADPPHLTDLSDLTAPVAVTATASNNYSNTNTNNTAAVADSFSASALITSTGHDSSSPPPSLSSSEASNDSTSASSSSEASSSSSSSSQPPPAHQQQQSLMRASSDTAALNNNQQRPLVRNTNSQPNHNKRNSFMSVRTAKSAVTSLVTEVPKPVATGSGVTCSIILAEPNIFLSGFDHDGHNHREGQPGTALLRGKLQLNVTKNVKIKAIQLKLLGRARTEWPEGIPPLKQDLFEEQGLRTQVLTFYNAVNAGWETEYGNQCTYKLKNGTTTNGSSTYLVVTPPTAGEVRGPYGKRLSLQSTQSRSFSKGESPLATPTQVKGFKVFHPGTYDYSFELPIDHHQLETIKLQYGSVRWELHATIDRAGAFKPNLHGMKEVSIVRVPDQMSLETTEPISISRQWEDQLHYDIIISGKSFPIGSKIPIAFKLTPLAKVQVHKLKVFLTESIEYWTNDRRVTRKDPGRKILLLEKSAGKPLDSQWSTSDLRTVRGGELTANQRREARELAALRRTYDASRRNESPDPLPEPTDNILGDLDLGLECYWGSTEIEANVQIPTCEMMAKNKELKLHPDCSWKNVNVYHWIKVVMRISRIDPDDPTGTKRRHFEISIDSPFTVLNCKATQANTNLPAYTGNMNPSQMYQSSCGCPDAHTVQAGVSPASSTGTLPAVDRSNENLPSMPQAAHLANGMANPASESQMSLPNDSHEPRPIHLLRAPSFNPPAFEADSAPPPLEPILVGDQLDNAGLPMQTPPPQYDVVVGTPSVDGMADYFSRLADYGFDDHDSGSDESDDVPPSIVGRSGRVHVAHPGTPGGRLPSRSMEISRPVPEMNMPTLPAQTSAN